MAGWRPAARIRVFSGFSGMGGAAEHPAPRTEMAEPPRGPAPGTRLLGPVAEMPRMAPLVTASVIRAGFPERPQPHRNAGFRGRLAREHFRNAGSGIASANRAW